MGDKGLTGIAALEAEMRDRLAYEKATIDRLTARALWNGNADAN